MRKLIQFYIIFIVLLGVLLNPGRVEAQAQCADWNCWSEACPFCDPYPGFKDVCTCNDDIDCAATPSLCVSCNPGYYVCNNGCCPIDPNPPGGGGGSCGDGTCDAGEDCNTCAADCGCPVVSVDIKADGSDTDITVAAPYNISWNSTNSFENACLLNGAHVDIAGAIGYSYDSGTRPYELTCSNLTTQDIDDVSVTVDCGILIPDVKANGSDTDITTFNDYTVSWSSVNATSCTLNGGAVGLSGSSVIPATINGIYPYSLACSTTVCSNTDNVNVEVNFCGNGTCSAFENCALCATDCGECPTAWWQVAGGSLFAGLTSGNAISSDIADSTTCIEPSCVPGLSIRDRALTLNSDGFPVTGGGAISSNGEMITYRDPDVFVVGTTTTRLIENYSYFYNKFSLGLSPIDDYSGSAGDALKPLSSKDAYFHSGDMTIQSPWDVTSSENYVVFVDGDLTIEDPLTEGELITVDEGGFLAFIVSGDISVVDSVGHSLLTNTTGNIEGVFIADGDLTIASNGTDDKKFIGEGSFVGWSGVSIARTYDEIGTGNSLYPAETFVYRPDLVKNTPEKMKRAQMLWQETN
ncbi:MAG: hypothetical protein HN912_02750 [Candidatus Pacebacteria bacterium]|nr:hypothetical protein [Candidatus Paceibacterota bacterium]MBT7183753.1 hypothetical protein [Candidatus Paceibacterota bacterium]